LALAVALALPALVAKVTEPAPATAEAKMAAPRALLLEQPLRQTLAPPLDRKLFVLFGLGLLILTVRRPRWGRCQSSSYNGVTPPRERLYKFLQLQLEGG
jgi:hypothetical protein